MVSILLQIPPHLQGVKKFVFGANNGNEVEEEHHFDGTRMSIFQQSVMLGSIKGGFAGLDQFPCNVNIEAIVDPEKVTEINGTIVALSPLGEKLMRSAIQYLEALMIIFAHQYPKSSFKIVYDQVVMAKKS